MSVIQEQINIGVSSSEIILNQLQKASSLIDPEYSIGHALQVQKNGHK